MFLSAGDPDHHPDHHDDCDDGHNDDPDDDHCIFDHCDYDHDDSDDCNEDQTTCLSPNVSFPGEEGVKLSTMEETGLTKYPFDMKA